KRATVVAFHSMLASAKTIEAYHNLNLDGEIGVILNLTLSYARSEDPADIKAAQIADLIYNRSFLDPSVLGEYPTELIDLIKELDMLPPVQDGDLETIKQSTVDFLGVNYYQPRRVQAKKTPVDSEKVLPENFFDPYIRPARKMNAHRAWAIDEKGIYDIAVNIKDKYKNITWYIAENGLGVETEERFIDDNGTVIDDYRIEFYQDHLKWLHKGIQEGSNCFGYHVWTFIDNWSWLNAYKNRYGFYRLDLDTKERSLKKSGEWYRDVIERNGF